jgi:hypothetical protein
LQPEFRPDWDNIVIRFDERVPAKLLPECRAKTILEVYTSHHLSRSGGEVGKCQTLGTQKFATTYGIQVRVDRGHLLLEDGIGPNRYARLPRVGHGVKRLVVIGSDGIVSLAALRWLADQDASFVMLERSSRCHRSGSSLGCQTPPRASAGVFIGSCVANCA